MPRGEGNRGRDRVVVHLFLIQPCVHEAPAHPSFPLWTFFDASSHPPHRKLGVTGGAKLSRQRGALREYRGVCATGAGRRSPIAFPSRRADHLRWGGRQTPTTRERETGAVSMGSS